ncbi:MAG: potassium channel family protein [Pseudomonadota bacterium]
MFIVVLLNCLLVALVVAVHYEFLFHATRLIPRLGIRPRLRIIFGVFVALVAHTVEIWIFAFAYYFMNGKDNWGGLVGNFDGSLLDCVYFSFITYSTVGFGDIHPIGDLRYLTGIESLTGLVLITWTASFLYYEMQNSWNGQ